MSMSGIYSEGDTAAFDRFRWTELATTFADTWGPMILTALRMEAPVSANGPDSGRLRDALHFERHTGIGSLSMIFTDDVPYFPYVIHGTTGGQTIVPVAARALHWTTGGTDVFAKSVIRGDTPANDFPSRVWDRMADVVMSAFRDTIREGLA